MTSCTSAPICHVAGGCGCAFFSRSNSVRFVRLVACGKNSLTPFMTPFRIRSVDSAQPCTPNPMSFNHAANGKNAMVENRALNTWAAKVYNISSCCCCHHSLTLYFEVPRKLRACARGCPLTIEEDNPFVYKSSRNYNPKRGRPSR